MVSTVSKPLEVAVLKPQHMLMTWFYFVEMNMMLKNVLICFKRLPELLVVS